MSPVNLGSAFGAVKIDTSGVTSSLNKTQQAMTGFQGKMNTVGASLTGIGKTMTLGLTLPLVGLGVAAGKVAIDFDKAMMGVNSVLKLSGAEFQALKADVLDFSTTTSKSSAEVAIALRGIVSSGFKAADAMDILRVAVDAAGNMNVDTATTTVALTSTLRAFGMAATEVTHVADVLQMAANNSAVVFDQLTGSIGTALGSASAAGITFETTAAALMTIADAGYSTAIATTNLNAVISAFLKPSEDLIEVIKSWGYETGEAALKAIGLEGVMKLLTESTGGSAAELAVLLPNVRAFKGAVALARDDGNAFAESLDEIGRASVDAGEHAAMAAVRHESWSYQITKLRSEVEVFAIRLAGVFMPAILDIVNVLKDWATTLATLDPKILKTIVAVAGFAAAAGPVLFIVPVLSALASGFGLLVTAIGIATGVATTLGAVLATMIPLAIIAALALLAKKIYDNVQAHKELAAEAIHTSSSYTEYREKVEDSARWTTTLSEEVWKLVQAKIELQGATGEAAAALAAEGIEQQKLLDAMQKAVEIGEVRLNSVHRIAIAEGELAKELVLQDAALREVAVARGLLTQEEVNAVVAAEDLAQAAASADEAMLGYAQATQEARVASDYYGEAMEEVEIGTWQAVTAAQSMPPALEEAAEAMRGVEAPAEDMIEHLRELARDPSVREHADQVRQMAQDVREAFRETALSYATFFGDVTESIEEHKAKLIEIEETSAADIEATRTKHLDKLSEMVRKNTHVVAEALEDHNRKIAGLQADYAQAETDAQRESIAARIKAEEEAWAERQGDLAYALAEDQRIANKAYGEAETKQAEHLAETLAKEEEAYAELQEEQRKRLGEMLMQQIDTWAEIDETVAENALSMKLTIAEEYGIITEEGRKQAEDMLGFLEEWRAGGIEKTDDVIAKFDEYLTSMQDGVVATEDLGGAITDVPALDIRHNLEDVIEGGRRAREAVEGIPSSKDVTVNFERTGWSGVQEMSPKTRIQHMLEDLLGFLKGTDFVVTFEAMGADKVEAMGDALRSLGEAFQAITTGLAVAGEWEPLAGFRDVIDQLVSDVRYVLVKVRTELLDLWGWAGQREDTVWGHMESWASAVGEVVELVGQAVEAFEGVNKYTGIMPGVIGALVADIKAVIAELVSIYQETPIHEFTVQWAQWAGALIGAAAGMITDMETLAAFQGGLRISAANVTDLIEQLRVATEAIITTIQAVVPELEDTSWIDRVEVSWAEFATGLISMFTDVQEDLAVLAQVQSPYVSAVAVHQLIGQLENAVSTIVSAIQRAVSIAEKEKGWADRWEVAWAEFAIGLVSMFTDVQEDLETLANVQSPYVSAVAVHQLIGQLGNTVAAIISAIQGAVSIAEKEKGWTDRWEVAWAEFATGLISIITGAISDMETIAAFEGGLIVAQSNVENLINTLKDVASWILNAIGEVGVIFTWATREADELKAEWLKFSAGLLSTLAQVVDDLQTIADYPGLQEGFAAAASMLATDLKAAVTEIVDALGDVSQDFRDAEGEIDETVAEWLEITTGIVASIAGAASDMATIAEYVTLPDIAAGARMLAQDLKAGVRAIVEAIGDVSTEFDELGVFVAQETVDWVNIVAGLVSDLASVVESLETIGGFRGGLASLETSIEMVMGSLGLIIEGIKLLAIQFDADARAAAQTFSNAMEPVFGITNDMITLIQALVDLADHPTIDAIIRKLGTGRDITTTPLGKATDLIVTTANYIATEIGTLNVDIDLTALGTAVGIVDSISVAVMQAIAIFEGLLGMTVPGTGLIDDFVAAVKYAYEAIKGAFTGEESIEIGFGVMVSNMLLAWQGLWGSIVSTVQTGVNDVRGALSGIPTHIWIVVGISSIRSAVNAIIAELARIPRTINVAVNVSGGGGAGGRGGSQQLRSYQYAGIVPGPIGKPQLAVVHGGERYLGYPERGGAGGGFDRASAQAFIGELVGAGLMGGGATINVETADPAPIGRQIDLVLRRQQMANQMSAYRG